MTILGRSGWKTRTPRTGNTPLRGAACCVFFWMLAGNAILAISAFLIAQHHSSFLTAADGFYWTTVACLLLARYVDIRYLVGLTADGEPATMAHWRRYAVILVVVAIALWVAVHAVGFLGS